MTFSINFAPILNRLSTRQLKFIANHFGEMGYLPAVHANLNKEYVQAILESESNSLEILSKALSDFDRTNLTDSEFDWIKTSNNRLCIYIQIYLFIERLSSYDIAMNSKNGRQHIISFFDDPSYGLEEKKKLMWQLRKSWELVLSQKYDWIDQKNSSQIDWIWNYLLKQNVFLYYDPNDSYWQLNFEEVRNSTPLEWIRNAIVAPPNYREFIEGIPFASDTEDKYKIIIGHADYAYQKVTRYKNLQHGSFTAPEYIDPRIPKTEKFIKTIKKAKRAWDQHLFRLKKKK